MNLTDDFSLSLPGCVVKFNGMAVIIDRHHKCSETRGCSLFLASVRQGTPAASWIFATYSRVQPHNTIRYVLFLCQLCSKAVNRVKPAIVPNMTTLISSIFFRLDRSVATGNDTRLERRVPRYYNSLEYVHDIICTPQTAIVIESMGSMSDALSC